jgi:hypothetical protein
VYCRHIAYPELTDEENMNEFNVGEIVEAPAAGYYSMPVEKVEGGSYLCKTITGVSMWFGESELRRPGSTKECGLFVNMPASITVPVEVSL